MTDPPLPLWACAALADTDDDVCQRKHGGNVMSGEAFAKIAGKPRGEICLRILAFVYCRGGRGATAWEAEQSLGTARSTVSARFTDLKRLNAIKGATDGDGKAITRPTVSSRARVFVADRESARRLFRAAGQESVDPAAWRAIIDEPTPVE